MGILIIPPIFCCIYVFSCFHVYVSWFGLVWFVHGKIDWDGHLVSGFLDGKGNGDNTYGFWLVWIKAFMV